MQPPVHLETLRLHRCGRLVEISRVWASSRRRQRCQSSFAPTAPVKDISQMLTLDNIRSSLIRQEDTIIFQLIERAQFARNDAVYTPDAVPVPGFNRDGRRYSLLQYVLLETEQLHAKLRRYTSPDEHPFFPDNLPPLVLPPISYPATLHPCSHSINLNSELMRVYLQEVLPGITQPGDDNNYGSAGVLDVLCLQALSKRIHYGKFVAEAKFQAQPQEYERLIRARDAQAILHLLTDKAVEQRVIERVRLKAATFGQDIVAPSQQRGSSSASSNDSGSNGEGSSDSSDTHLPGLLPPQGGPSQPATTSLPTALEGLSSKEAAGPRLKVSPDVVAALYERWVMPLTKEVEVQYLLARLG